MARKKVIDLDVTSTVTFEKPGQSVEGYYIGFKTVDSDYGKSKLHVLQGTSGNMGIWGSAKLDEKLNSVAPGTMTFITYQGKVKIGGGKTMKKFEVEFDDELTIEVTPASVNFSANAELEDAEETEEYVDESEAESEMEAAEEEIEQVAAPAPVKRAAPVKGGQVSPEAQARVNALLTKRR